MVLKYALIPAAIVALFLGITLAVAYFNTPEKSAVSGNENFSFGARLQESGIAVAGEKNAAYATVEFSGSGVERADFSFLWFGEPAPRSVYLLNYPATDAENYQS
ncbi:MAG: hypothetical protein AB1468_06620, partial [Candidatus Micrarchaeota archaeon]